LVPDEWLLQLLRYMQLANGDLKLLRIAGWDFEKRKEKKHGNTADEKS